jgi:hypothetical protein
MALLMDCNKKYRDRKSKQRKQANKKAMCGKIRNEKVVSIDGDYHTYWISINIPVPLQK